MGQGGIPCPKPSRADRRRAERVEDQQDSARTRTVREKVFTRDYQRCRVCGRPAESMHELKFRSLGGRPSLKNSIATCGSGTTGCHGKLQRRELLPTTMNANNKDLRFYPNPNYARRE